MSSPSSPPRTHQQGVFRRALGAPILFAIIYTSVASAIYFSLGVVADHALGLTPVVYLLAGLFFVLATMTYVEGASLHQDRGGATVFARYAFNELWSFVAGWAILLDFLILIAVTSLSATNYLAAFWGEAGAGAVELVIAFAIILYVAIAQHPGLLGDALEAHRRARHRRPRAAAADHRPRAHRGASTSTQLTDVDRPRHDADLEGLHLRADGVATVAFTGLESASGLAGEVAVGRRGLKRLVSSAAACVRHRPTPASRSPPSPRCPSWTARRELGSPELHRAPGASASRRRCDPTGWPTA